MHKLLWAGADTTTPRQETGQKPRVQKRAPATGDPPHPRSALLSVPGRQTWGARCRGFTNASHTRPLNFIKHGDSQRRIQWFSGVRFSDARTRKVLPCTCTLSPRFSVRPRTDHRRERTWGGPGCPPQRPWEAKGWFPPEDPCPAAWACAKAGARRLGSNTWPSGRETLVPPQDQSPCFRRAAPALAPRKWDSGSHPCTNSSPPPPPLPTRERINRRGDNGFKKYTHPTVTVPGTQAISFVPGQPSLTNPRFSLGPLLTQPEIIPVFSNCPDLIKCRRQAGWCLRGSVRDRQGHRSRSAGTRLWSRDCTPHPAAFRPLRPGGPRPTPALRASGSSRGRLPPGKVAAFPREGRASASGWRLNSPRPEVCGASRDDIWAGPEDSGPTALERLPSHPGAVGHDAGARRKCVSGTGIRVLWVEPGKRPGEQAGRGMRGRRHLETGGAGNPRRRAAENQVGFGIYNV